MNNIVDIMLGSIRAQICGLQYQINKDISEDELIRLYKLSKSQDVAHIVATELSRQGVLKDDEIGRKFKKQQMLAVLRYERINYELEEICRVLEEAEIPHMPLKGSVLRKYYPEPWMRTSADIDILVDEENAHRAAERLEKELGYANQGDSPHDVQMFAPSGVHLELHFETIEAERVANVNPILSKIWEYSSPTQGHKYQYQTDDAMFYFYHVAHMAKHFKHGGCGVRFFLDLWILEHNTEGDRENRQKLIAEGGIVEFVDLSKELSEAWFSMGTHSEMSRTMEQYVLNGGVYGSTANNMVLTQIKTGGHKKYIMARIFLPYEKMKQLYPTLEKHKWLLPIYEVRRWLRIIFCGGLKRSTQEIKQSSSITDNDRSRVDSMMSFIGL